MRSFVYLHPAERGAGVRVFESSHSPDRIERALELLEKYAPAAVLATDFGVEDPNIEYDLMEKLSKFAPIAGAAAPFLNIIPGVGPVLSAAATAISVGGTVAGTLAGADVAGGPEANSTELAVYESPSNAIRQIVRVPRIRTASIDGVTLFDNKKKRARNRFNRRVNNAVSKALEGIYRDPVSGRVVIKDPVTGETRDLIDFAREGGMFGGGGYGPGYLTDPSGTYVPIYGGAAPYIPGYPSVAEGMGYPYQPSQTYPIAGGPQMPFPGGYAGTGGYYPSSGLEQYEQLELLELEELLGEGVFVYQDYCDGDETCEACKRGGCATGDKPEFIPGTVIPSGTIHRDGIATVSLVDMPRGVHGKITLRGRQYPIEINRADGEQRNILAIAHEYLHAFDVLAKKDWRHEELHQIAQFIASTIVPAIESYSNAVGAASA